MIMLLWEIRWDIASILFRIGCWINGEHVYTLREGRTKDFKTCDRCDKYEMVK